MKTYHEVNIVCPQCKSIQNAKVVYTIPSWTYYHCCMNCGYEILESEWKEVKESNEKK